MKRSLAVLLACCVALPALAQDASRDWDMHRDPRNRLLMAYTEFDNGMGIATRCVDGGFEAVMTGLPPAGERTTRPLRIAFGDDDLIDTRWNVAENDTVAVSELPAPFARNLREGGRLRILIPGGAEGGRNLLYDLTLPASSGAIDETLTACRRPLTDPRDAQLEALPEEGVPADIVWVSRPRAQYPSSIRYGRGFAVVTCVPRPDGVLGDCVVEMEHPRDGGFGESTLRAARRSRVRNALASASDAPVPPVRVMFRATFVLDGYQTREDQQAQREGRRQERQERSAARAATDGRTE